MDESIENGQSTWNVETIMKVSGIYLLLFMFANAYDFFVAHEGALYFYYRIAGLDRLWWLLAVLAMPVFVFTYRPLGRIQSQKKGYRGCLRLIIALSLYLTICSICGMAFLTFGNDSKLHETSLRNEDGIYNLSCSLPGHVTKLLGYENWVSSAHSTCSLYRCDKLIGVFCKVVANYVDGVVPGHGELRQLGDIIQVVDTTIWPQTEERIVYEYQTGGNN